MFETSKAFAPRNEKGNEISFFNYYLLGRSVDERVEPKKEGSPLLAAGGDISLASFKRKCGQG